MIKKIIDGIAFSLVVVGVVVISKNVETDDNSTIIDTSARCVDYSNGIATFETEDGNLWEYEIDARKNDVYVITFDTKGTASIYDDEIKNIK